MSNNGSDFVSDTFYQPFAKNVAKDRQALYEQMYIRKLSEFAIGRFKWINLPDEIDARFLELILHKNGLALFFYDDTFNRYMALRGSGSGHWNMYDNPIEYTAVGPGYSKRLRAGNSIVNDDNIYDDVALFDINRIDFDRQLTECVPIWANYMRTPDWDIVYLYATKLAAIERTIEINVQAMRTPFLFTVDDNERLTFQNLWKQIQNGQPAIFGTNTMGNDIDSKVKLFSMPIDRELVPNLQVAKTRLWNECMTLLGINNANQDKRERLVADEVSSNNSQITIARNISMEARQYAAKQINKKYDLKIECIWNEQSGLLLPNGEFVDTISGEAPTTLEGNNGSFYPATL